MNELDLARMEHENAKRHLRRLQEEARDRATGWRLMDRCNAQERVSRTLAKLEELEARELAASLATRPDGAESRQHNPSTPAA